MSTLTNKINFVFFGTPEVSSKTLEILKSHGYVPSLIVTASDRPVGRHFTMTPSPTKTWAIENNIPFTHELPTDSSYDLFIVVAYGKILPQRVIDMPKFGTLNIHYSLLPRWRGASPVEAAILHGDTETGVSIQKMVFKLDAGPIIAEEHTSIDPNETHVDLRNRLIPMGAELLVSLFEKMNFEGKEQDESQMTHCGKTRKEDALINPFADNPQELWNKYRAYFGWPGIYFMDSNNKRVKITRAKFEDGKFIIERVVREGKPESDY